MTFRITKTQEEPYKAVLPPEQVTPASIQGELPNIPNHWIKLLNVPESHKLSFYLFEILTWSVSKGNCGG